VATLKATTETPPERISNHNNSRKDFLREGTWYIDKFLVENSASRLHKNSYWRIQHQGLIILFHSQIPIEISLQLFKLFNQVSLWVVTLGKNYTKTCSVKCRLKVKEEKSVKENMLSFHANLKGKNKK
jgi:hypothetical protein